MANDMTAPPTGNPTTDGARRNTPQKRMVESLDVLVQKQDSLIAVMGSVARDMSTLAQRSLMYSSPMPAAMQAQSLARARAGFSAGMPAATALAAPPAPAAMPERPMPTPPQPASRTETPMPERVAPAFPRADTEMPEPPRPAALKDQDSVAGGIQSAQEARRRRAQAGGWPPESWSEGYDPRSLTKARESMVTELGKYLQQMDPGAKYVELADGRFVPSDVYEATVGDSNVPGWFTFADEGIGPGDRGYNAARIRRGASNVFSQVGSTMARTGSVTAGLNKLRVPGFGGAAMTVGKFAGAAGVAAMAAGRAAKFAADQRRANMVYQSELGGSNTRGFGERMNRWLYSIPGSGFGSVMSSGDANAIFDNAMSAVGNDGERRQAYMDASQSLYRHAGMDPRSSKSVLDAAAAANADLRGVADALVGLSTAAQDFSMNASEARDAFESTFRAMYSNVGPDRATAVAEATTMAQLTYGAPGMDGLTIGSDSNRNAKALAAGIAGVTIGQFEAMQTSGDSQQVSIAGQAMAQAESMTLMASAPGMSSPAVPQIVAEVLKGEDGFSVTDTMQLLKRFPDSVYVEIGRRLQAAGIILDFAQGSKPLSDAMGITISTIEMYQLYHGMSAAHLAQFGSPLTANAVKNMNDPQMMTSIGGIDPSTGQPLTTEQKVAQAQAAISRSGSGTIGGPVYEPGTEGPRPSGSGARTVQQAQRSLYEAIENNEITDTGASIVTRLLTEGRGRDKYLVQVRDESDELRWREVNLAQAMSTPEFMEQIASGSAVRKGQSVNLASELGMGDGSYVAPAHSSLSEGARGGSLMPEDFDPLAEGREREMGDGAVGHVTVQLMPIGNLQYLLDASLNGTGIVQIQPYSGPSDGFSTATATPGRNP